MDFSLLSPLEFFVDPKMSMDETINYLSVLLLFSSLFLSFHFSPFEFIRVNFFKTVYKLSRQYRGAHVR